MGKNVSWILLPPFTVKCISTGGVQDAFSANHYVQLQLGISFHHFCFCHAHISEIIV